MLADIFYKCEKCGGSGKLTFPYGRLIGTSNARTMKPVACIYCDGDGEVMIEIEDGDEKAERMEKVRPLAYGGRYYRGPRVAQRFQKL